MEYFSIFCQILKFWGVTKTILTRLLRLHLQFFLHEQKPLCERFCNWPFIVSLTIITRYVTIIARCVQMTILDFINLSLSRQWPGAEPSTRYIFKLLVKKPYTFNMESFKKFLFSPYIQADSLSFQEIYFIRSYITKKRVHIELTYRHLSLHEATAIISLEPRWRAQNQEQDRGHEWSATVQWSTEDHWKPENGSEPKTRPRWTMQIIAVVVQWFSRCPVGGGAVVAFDGLNIRHSGNQDRYGLFSSKTTLTSVSDFLLYYSSLLPLLLSVIALIFSSPNCILFVTSHSFSFNYNFFWLLFLTCPSFFPIKDITSEGKVWDLWKRFLPSLLHRLFLMPLIMISSSRQFHVSPSQRHQNPIYFSSIQHFLIITRRVLYQTVLFQLSSILINISNISFLLSFLHLSSQS